MSKGKVGLDKNRRKWWEFQPATTKGEIASGDSGTVPSGTSQVLSMARGLGH
jgi:hypothetical protein